MRTLPWCPSVLPASPERRVRRASRPFTVPIARAGLLQQHDIARDALGGCEATSRLLDAPRADDLIPNAVPRPHPLHKAPTHPRYATRQALLFLDVRIALINPTGAVTIFTRVRFAGALSACLRASELGCPTPLPCAAPIHPFLHHIHRFSHLPPTTTISGTTILSPSTPAPLMHHLHHHSARAAHPHARAAPAAAVPYRRLRTDRHQAHHSRLPPDSALSSRRLRLSATRPDLHQCPALARSAVPPRGRATRCLCARCDVLGTLPL
jgi:hypothetical protein